MKDFLHGLGNGDEAAWAQALGTVLAILASGWVAVWQSKSQYKNSLELQAIQDKNKEIVLTEAVVKIIENSAERVKYVFDTFTTRQDIDDVASKVKYFDFEALNDVIESLKQIPLKDLPSPDLVSAVMVLISSIRQLSIQVDKAIANNRTMSAADIDTFLKVVSQVKNSTADIRKTTKQYLGSIKHNNH